MKMIIYIGCSCMLLSGLILVSFAETIHLYAFIGLVFISNIGLTMFAGCASSLASSCFRKHHGLVTSVIATYVSVIVTIFSAWVSHYLAISIFNLSTFYILFACLTFLICHATKDHSCQLEFLPE